jgi:hypothetical protein
MPTAVAAQDAQIKEVLARAVTAIEESNARRGPIRFKNRSGKLHMGRKPPKDREPSHERREKPKPEKSLWMPPQLVLGDDVLVQQGTGDPVRGDVIQITGDRGQFVSALLFTPNGAVVAVHGLRHHLDPERGPEDDRGFWMESPLSVERKRLAEWVKNLDAAVVVLREEVAALKEKKK